MEHEPGGDVAHERRERVVAHAAYGIGGQLQTRRPMRGRLLPLRGQADDVDVQPQLSGETVNQ